VTFVLRKIGVWSAVKTGFFVWGFIGFIAGLYVAMMMPVLIKVMESFGGLGSDLGAIGPIAFIFMPILYSIISAVTGTILTALVAGFYNLIASFLGGVIVELDGDAIAPIDLGKAPPSSAPDSGNFSI
jgi:hypothetical protein